MGRLRSRRDKGRLGSRTEEERRRRESVERRDGGERRSKMRIFLSRVKNTDASSNINIRWGSK